MNISRLFDKRKVFHVQYALLLFSFRYNLSFLFSLIRKERRNDVNFPKKLYDFLTRFFFMLFEHRLGVINELFFFLSRNDQKGFRCIVYHPRPICFWMT